jgi:flavorubredoxin
MENIKQEKAKQTAAFAAQKIADDVYFVGAKDYNQRSFHGFRTDRGVTYNAYLVTDKKLTLIDSVKRPFTEEMLCRIESVAPVGDIEIIVSNHAEYDHSGALRAVFDRAKNAAVYATAAGIRSLKNMYGDMNYKEVKSGDTISGGKYSFTFLPTPMVHWPDNMVTLLNEKKLLFSNDAFGQHIAAASVFDVDNDPAVTLFEARKYYANIVMPYAAQTVKALEAVRALGVNVIAPSHGLVLTKSVPDMLNVYADVTSGKKEDLAAVVYDTMWGNTEKLAYVIGGRLEKEYKKVVYCNLAVSEKSDIIELLSRASLLALGSPTQNNGVTPPVAALLCYIEGLKPRGLKYISFGSFGWAGGAVKKIDAVLDSLGYEKLSSVALQFTPDAAAALTLLDRVK